MPETRLSEQMKSYSEFHDGFLEGLWIDGTTAYLYLSTVERKRFTAIAHGVVALSASRFKVGNIVFEVVTRETNEITLDDVAELYDLQNGAEGQRQGSQLLEKAQREKSILFEISPSYGAACLVLARTVELAEGARSPLTTDNQHA